MHISHKLLNLPTGIALLATGVLVGALTLGVAKAQDANTIHACVLENQNGQGNSGAVRIVSDEADCKSNEYYLSWNEEGPAGPPGSSGSSLKVLDSLGQEVGLAIDTDGSVARKVGSDWVGIEVWKNDIPKTDIILEYESNDCTGQSYMQAGSVFANGKVRGTQLYYPGGPGEYRDLGSVRNVDADGNLTPCELWIHNRITAPTVITTIPAFVPPFHVAE